LKVVILHLASAPAEALSTRGAEHGSPLVQSQSREQLFPEQELEEHVVMKVS
jgi:hypothetical protein